MLVTDKINVLTEYYIELNMKLRGIKLGIGAPQNGLKETCLDVLDSCYGDQLSRDIQEKVNNLSNEFLNYKTGRIELEIDTIGKYILSILMFSRGYSTDEFDEVKYEKWKEFYEKNTVHLNE